MLHCRKCGSPLQTGDKFCMKCGEKVQEKKRGYRFNSIVIISAVVVIIIVACFGGMYVQKVNKEKRILAEIEEHNRQVASYKERVLDYYTAINEAKGQYKTLGDILSTDSRTNFGFGIDEEFNMGNTYSIFADTIMKMKDERLELDKMIGDIGALYIEDEETSVIKETLEKTNVSYIDVYNMLINKDFVISTFSTDWKMKYEYFDANVNELGTYFE